MQVPVLRDLGYLYPDSLPGVDQENHTVISPQQEVRRNLSLKQSWLAAGRALDLGILPDPTTPIR